MRTAMSFGLCRRCRTSPANVVSNLSSILLRHKGAPNFSVPRSSCAPASSGAARSFGRHLFERCDSKTAKTRRASCVPSEKSACQLEHIRHGGSMPTDASGAPPRPAELETALNQAIKMRSGRSPAAKRTSIAFASTGFRISSARSETTSAGSIFDRSGYFGAPAQHPALDSSRSSASSAPYASRTTPARLAPGSNFGGASTSNGVRRRKSDRCTA
mmetsp:Transcript_13332/g.44577  ORF Transcript_13332/g.44577 Transcript_13332/m.44577 type:complete len:216 (+) Transcript_13332:524-1171(+)